MDACGVMSSCGMGGMFEWYGRGVNGTKREWMYVWKDEKILKKTKSNVKIICFCICVIKKPKAMYILYVIVYIICIYWSAFVEKMK